MKILILKDGSEVQFTHSSSIANLTTVVEDFNDVEDLRELLSEDNLSECSFEGIEYTDVLLDTVATVSKGYDNVQVTFSTKMAADAEIAALQQQIANLENENIQLSDKAEAADILMGNEE